MSSYLRTAYDRTLGKSVSFYVNLKKHTKEEADEMFKAWKAKLMEKNEAYSAQVKKIRGDRAAAITHERMHKVPNSRISTNIVSIGEGKGAASNLPQVQPHQSIHGTQIPGPAAGMTATSSGLNVDHQIEDNPNIAEGEVRATVGPIDPNAEVININYGLPSITLAETILMIEKEATDNQGATVTLIGSSKSGKTTLLQKLHARLSKKRIVPLFCENHENPKYDEMKKHKHTVANTDFKPKMIEMLHKIQDVTDRRYDILNILDDVVDMKDAAMLGKLYTTYRNARMSTIVCLQDSTMLKKTNRGQSNFLYLLRLNNNELVEDVLDRFAGPFLQGNKATKLATYSALVADYHAIFIDCLNNKAYQVKL